MEEKLLKEIAVFLAKKIEREVKEKEQMQQLFCSLGQSKITTVKGVCNG